MEAEYRGCKIEAHRAKSLGGWSEVYWSAFSKTGYEINSGFGGGTVRECFTSMKSVVDEFMDTYGGDWRKHSEDAERIALMT